MTPGGTVTAQQLRDLLERLITAGQWSIGAPDILIVADAGYDAPRLAFLLEDLPLQLLAPGCASTESCVALSRPGSRTPGAGHPGTVASSSSGSPTPGASRTPKPSPTHASTTPPPPVPGTA
ncbi:transposase [Streptomyces sp. NBC_01799]|nr:transposase [Streptomyces sp. NBC_01799]